MQLSGVLPSLPSRLRTVRVPKALLRPGRFLVQVLAVAVGTADGQVMPAGRAVIGAVDCRTLSGLWRGGAELSQGTVLPCLEIRTLEPSVTGRLWPVWAMPHAAGSPGRQHPFDLDRSAS
jgi:hypothetical protein